MKVVPTQNEVSLIVYIVSTHKRLDKQYGTCVVESATRAWVTL
jgi:hypothetical protein